MRIYIFAYLQSSPSNSGARWWKRSSWRASDRHLTEIHTQPPYGLIRVHVAPPLHPPCVAKKRWWKKGTQLIRDRCLEGQREKHNQELSVNAILKQEGEAGGRGREERRCFGYDLFALTMSRNHHLWTCVLETSVLVPLRQHDEAALFHHPWDHTELSTLLPWHVWNVRGTGRG